MKLQGEKVYLAVMEKEDCVKLWKDFEYNFEEKTEVLNIGHSITKAEDWFEDIQKNQGDKHIRLGIFLNTNEIVGDIALQNIDWKERVCSIGIGISSMANRSKGYGGEAIQLILDHAFNNIGLERVTAATFEQNYGSQKSLERNGFVLEGRERKAVSFAGRRWDRLNYGMIRDDLLSYKGEAR